MGANQPVFVWNNVRPVIVRQVAKAVKDVLELLGYESAGYSTQLQNQQSNERSDKGSIRCPTKGPGKMEEHGLLKLHQA